MAIFPNSFQGQDRLQPGARGEIFQADMPGYRDGADRINRTNMKLATNAHDTPNIKWEFDRRLPSLFKYGFAYGYNNMVIPKGRICAVDPTMNLLDFETHKAYNALTLANGGVPVKLRTDKKLWEPIQGLTTAYVTLASGEKVYRAFTKSVPALMTDAKATFDAKSGMIAVDGKVTADVRPANQPIGIMSRNEYTRNDDAFNGMQPGAIMTDAMVELPMFLDKAKAEQNPWGSVYGQILPGDFVKSDENGRLVVSPLSRMDEVETLLGAPLTASEIEKERQQIVGQVYSVSRDLIPAGAAKYATWALSDRLNFEGFNPQTFRANNRDGEDSLEHSAYGVQASQSVFNNNTNMTGVDPIANPGYPYDQTMSQNDLHMLASSVRQASGRMNFEYQYENLGIPGLTDGYNAVVRNIGPEQIGIVRNAASADAFVDMFFKTTEVSFEKGSFKIAVSPKSTKDLIDADFTAAAVEGQPVPVTVAGETATFLNIKFLDEIQGIFVIEVSDKAAAYAFLAKHAADLESSPLTIRVKYSKRGMAGVPTFLDWDGCMGVVKVLLQK